MSISKRVLIKIYLIFEYSINVRIVHLLMHRVWYFTIPLTILLFDIFNVTFILWSNENTHWNLLKPKIFFKTIHRRFYMKTVDMFLRKINLKYIFFFYTTYNFLSRGRDDKMIDNYGIINRMNYIIKEVRNILYRIKCSSED